MQVHLVSGSRSLARADIDIPQYTLPWSPTCTFLTKTLLLDFHRMCLRCSFFLFEPNLESRDMDREFSLCGRVLRPNLYLWRGNTDPGILP